MNFFQEVEGFFVTTEAEVLTLIVDIKNDAEIALTDIDNALKWIEGQAPAIASSVQTVTSLVQQVPGIASNPTVATAIKDANLAVTALNAAAAASASGQGQAQAVLDGYIAIKQAQAATASAAAAAVAAAPAQKPASPSA